jgi:biotin carboxyl carrier protein
VTTYLVLLDGGRREASVGVTRHGPGRYEVRVGDEVHVVDACALDGATLSLVADTESYAATLDERGGRVNVRVRGSVFPLEILDERKLRLRRGAGRPAAPGRQAVTSPMPGKVVRVLVKRGDEVKEGQGLVVVEMMSMESVMRSPKDGRVVELHVSEGQPVERNAKLCVVE